MNQSIDESGQTAVAALKAGREGIMNLASALEDGGLPAGDSCSVYIWHTLMDSLTSAAQRIEAIIDHLE